MLKEIDFLIIGAQKSGTTTLFKNIAQHPDIYMPLAKEVPFFTVDQVYEKGLAEYKKEHFKNAKTSQLWGTATPHYLCDPRAAGRVAEALPNVKLIAILREPVARSLSHYRMSKRRGIEHRSFEQAISHMLAEEELKASRKMITGIASEASTYLVWGEYGRLLKPYYERFPEENILILFTEELELAPETVIKNILEFLGVASFSPDTMGKRFHEGGAQERFPFVRAATRIKLISTMLKRIPVKYRSRLVFWFNQINIVKEITDLSDYSSDLIEQLKLHYETDKILLQNLIGRNVPDRW